MPTYDAGKEFEEFRYTLPMRGFEDQLDLFYSVYRAKVTGVEDPEERGRVQVTIPSVGMGGNDSCDYWIDPLSDMTGPGMGWFNPPVVGSFVRVMFDRGDPSLPKAYTGGWFTRAEGTSPLPAMFGYVDGKPQKRGFRSRAGHVLQFDDTPGSEAVRLIWHKPDPSDPASSDAGAVAKSENGKYAVISFEPDGSIQLRNSKGAMVNMAADDGELQVVDDAGNRIDMKGAAGIVITANTQGGADYIKMDRAGTIDLVAGKSINLVAPVVNCKSGGVYSGEMAAASAVLGEALLSWLTAHTHPTGMGPSGVPLVLPTPALLSASVKVKT